jgi:hypothetical protein
LRFLKKSLLGDGWSIKLPSVALSWLCKMCVCVFHMVSNSI